MNLLKAVLRLSPNARCSLFGEEVYENIVWDCDSVLIPTKEAVLAEINTIVQENTITTGKDAIDKERDLRLMQGVSWNDKMWHTDSDFQTQITGLISAVSAGILPSTTVFDIRTKDNTIEKLDVTQLKQLAGTVMQYVQGVYQWSWNQKDALTSGGTQ